MLALYRTLTALGAPLIRRHLRRRAAEGKEDTARLSERFGQAGMARPDGKLVWLHAASVGEATSVLPLVERLLERRKFSILVTSGTVTSAGMLAKRLPSGALHQFVPADIPSGVNAFLDHWRPDFAIWVESELWPNLITATAARGTPMVLIQARLSDASVQRWRRAPGLIRRMLGCFRLVLAQTEANAERFRALGARSVAVTSTLKYATPPLAAEHHELMALQRQIGGRPLWVAASTHAGDEETAVLDAHAALAERMPDVLTIIVPRHPERGDDVAAAAEARGYGLARRTAADLIEAHHQIYLADTLGELGLFYRIAPVAFVGGTLAPVGGHNIIEPIQLGAAVVCGPDLANFSEVADDLTGAEALRTVADAHQLAGTVGSLLRDSERRGDLVQRQKGVTDSRADVLEDVMAALAPYLPVPDKD
ncbi:MAG: 3-deoxy-D-manno-octulosonic acid transferase [Alphaproteobacteria bacterium]|jgi:3-deoxy-D-manno-octulosonic-acid transferase|nr:3-deoxy-D-manno-octulosonic acid transferase [Alphaproteobacteria bacterium]